MMELDLMLEPELDTDALQLLPEEASLTGGWPGCDNLATCRLYSVNTITLDP